MKFDWCETNLNVGCREYKYGHCEMCNIAKAYQYGYEIATENEAIKRQNDVIAVVRCKDCKWQKFIDWGMGDCLHPKGSKHIAYDNHYCSYGERREE